ncbi:hypothetical protein B0H13DRAFT_1918892 [Mycena leptocephala]|nr:hypothetical protein B0H13DRAFT_1918892 [Mycena leptocephala]
MGVMHEWGEDGTAELLSGGRDPRRTGRARMEHHELEVPVAGVDVGVRARWSRGSGAQRRPQIKASKLPLCTTSTKLLSRTSGRAVYAARIKTWQVSLNQVQVKPSGLLLKLHQVHRLIVEDAAARMLSKSCSNGEEHKRNIGAAMAIKDGGELGKPRLYASSMDPMDLRLYGSTGSTVGNPFLRRHSVEGGSAYSPTALLQPIQTYLATGCFPDVLFKPFHVT